MSRWTRRSWLTNTIGVVLIFLVVWIAAAFWAETSLGASFPILADLRSRILADYGFDFFGDTLQSLKLTILGDVSDDSGLAGDGDVDPRNSLVGFVPTATDQEAVTELAPSNTPTDDPEDAPTATATQIEATETTVSSQAIDPVATHTPQPIKTSDPTPSDQQLIPKLECVEYYGGGNFTAYFGYKNPNSKIIVLSVGPENHFEPIPEDRGQPTSFEPGQTPGYPNAAFEVLFSGESLTWDLDGNSVTASSSSEVCEVPSTPTATPIPTPKPDTAAPVLSGGVISPPPGKLSVCSISVTLDNLYVSDPAPSSGINWVKLKYEIAGFTEPQYIFSGNFLSSCAGGFTPEGGWGGTCSNLSIEIDIDSDWVPLENDPFTLTVWSKVKDNSGNTSFLEHANYTMPASCGD
ncbi:MAG: hypothetical protein IIC78_04390 [Chloroflexi bacterium]|nr:hypothetical protein [Chloroflexota bacterium]